LRLQRPVRCLPTITLAPRLPRDAPIESIGGPLSVRPVRPGFIGLSIECYAVQAYAGADPRALDPVFCSWSGILTPGRRQS